MLSNLDCPSRHLKLTRTCCAFVFTSLVVAQVHAQDFYDSSFETRDVVVDLQVDYGANGYGNLDDSARLQSAIDFVSNQGGGVVSIPCAEYTFSEVNLKSNVHIEIEAGTQITPYVGNATTNLDLFNFGRYPTPIENVSVRGIGGNFHVTLDEYAKGTTVFGMNDVTNFYVANVDIYDNLSKFSSFGLSPGLNNNTYTGIPTQGTIENARAFNAAYGYGLVQVQSGDSINFRNLFSEGGAALRLESGWTKMNDLQVGGIFDIVGEDITNWNGNASVMLSPHAMFNGDVTISDIFSIGSGFAVRAEGGFVSNKYTNPDLVPGDFDSVTLTNIFAAYGENAQLKSKHFKFVPDELEHLIQPASTSEDGSSVRGPSIAAVHYEPNYDVFLSNVSGRDFLYNPLVVPASSATAASIPEPSTVLSCWIAIATLAGRRKRCDC